MSALFYPWKALASTIAVTARAATQLLSALQQTQGQQDKVKAAVDSLLIARLAYTNANQAEKAEAVCSCLPAYLRKLSPDQQWTVLPSALKRDMPPTAVELGKRIEQVDKFVSDVVRIIQTENLSRFSVVWLSSNGKAEQLDEHFKLISNQNLIQIGQDLAFRMLWSDGNALPVLPLKIQCCQRVICRELTKRSIPIDALQLCTYWDWHPVIRCQNEPVLDMLDVLLDPSVNWRENSSPVVGWKVAFQVVPEFLQLVCRRSVCLDIVRDRLGYEKLITEVLLGLILSPKRSEIPISAADRSESTNKLVDWKAACSIIRCAHHAIRRLNISQLESVVVMLFNAVGKEMNIFQSIAAGTVLVEQMKKAAEGSKLVPKYLSPARAINLRLVNLLAAVNYFCGALWKFPRGRKLWYQLFLLIDVVGLVSDLAVEQLKKMNAKMPDRDDNEEFSCDFSEERLLHSGTKMLLLSAACAADEQQHGKKRLQIRSKSTKKLLCCFVKIVEAAHSESKWAACKEMMAYINETAAKEKISTADFVHTIIVGLATHPNKEKASATAWHAFEFCELQQKTLAIFISAFVTNSQQARELATTSLAETNSDVRNAALQIMANDEKGLWSDAIGVFWGLQRAGVATCASYIAVACICLRQNQWFKAFQVLDEIRNVNLFRKEIYFTNDIIERLISELMKAPPPEDQEMDIGCFSKLSGLIYKSKAAYPTDCLAFTYLSWALDYKQTTNEKKKMELKRRGKTLFRHPLDVNYNQALTMLFEAAERLNVVQDVVDFLDKCGLEEGTLNPVVQESLENIMKFKGSLAATILKCRVNRQQEHK